MFFSDLLPRLGQILYGARWQRPLCLDLGVHVETLRRWLDDPKDMPGTAAEKMLAVARARRIEIDKAFTEWFAAANRDDLDAVGYPPHWIEHYGDSRRAAAAERARARYRRAATGD